MTTTEQAASDRARPGINPSLRATIRQHRVGSAPAWTAIDFARNIHLTFYDQVKAADQKAGYVFTFLTILFVFTRDPRNIVLNVAQGPTFSARWFISSLFILSAAFSLICAALVVPAAGQGGHVVALYWGAWAFDDEKDRKVAAHLNDDDIIAEYLADSRNLARLCRAKYTFVNLAFRAAALTIGCHLLLLMMG